MNLETSSRIEAVEKQANYEMEDETKGNIGQLESMTREQFKTYAAKMEEAEDYDALQMFNEVRRKEPIALRKLVSTRESRINEINFNIAYEKYFGEK